jgi:hypothetical protein
VQLIERKAAGPEQSAAEGALRLLVGVDPASAVLSCRGALDKRAAAGKALGTALVVPPLPPDEGAQLGLTDGLLAVGLGYFFFPRAP